MVSPPLFSMVVVASTLSLQPFMDHHRRKEGVREGKEGGREGEELVIWPWMAAQNSENRPPLTSKALFAAEAVTGNASFGCVSFSDYRE